MRSGARRFSCSSCWTRSGSTAFAWRPMNSTRFGALCSAEADGLLFNSAFTERQFERRFALRPDVPRLSSLHSLRVGGLRLGILGRSDGEGLLIVGNGFAHKYVARGRIAAGRGRPRPSHRGARPEAGRDRGGHQLRVRAPRRRTRSPAFTGRPASWFIPPCTKASDFPCSRRSRIAGPCWCARSRPSRNCWANCRRPPTSTCFDTDAELIALAGSDLRWTDERRDVPVRDWSDSTNDLLQILEAAVRGVDYDRVVRRLDFMRAGWSGSAASGSGPTKPAGKPGARMSNGSPGWAGRIAQDAVLKLARAPGSRGIVGLAKKVLRRGVEA